MKKLELPQRMESHQQYEANKRVNKAVQDAFTASLETLQQYDFNIVEPNGNCLTVETPYSDVIGVSCCGDIKYGGTTTLKDSGCAVFCFYQGLCLTRPKVYVSLSELAQEIAEKGYYEPGKGTYHCLYDHWGLRRASHFCEVIDTIKRGSIVTCLVQNSKYHQDENRTGKHFVNVVGLYNDSVIVDDSHIGRRILKMESFMKSVLIAWTW